MVTHWIFLALLALFLTMQASMSTPSPTVTSVTEPTVANTSEPDQIGGSTPQPQMTLCNESYTMYSTEIRTCFLIGLQCKFGRCDLGSGFSCTCDPGAVGMLCDQQCCLDCGDHGSCYYDSSNDVEFCNCEFQYRGERCEERITKPSEPPSATTTLPIESSTTTPSPTVTSATEPTVTSTSESYQNGGSTPQPQMTLCNESYTMYSTEIRTCFLIGLQCKFGRCDQGSGFSCTCDPGAVGMLCDQQCCLDCGDHGNCYYDSANDVEFCNCEFQYRGERCEERITKPSEPPSATTTLPIESSTTNAATTTLCNESYTMYSTVIRTCLLIGLQCKFGRCDIGGEGFSCTCDPGAVGMLCDQQCCLDCGDHGRCYYDSTNDVEFCNCEFQYRGERCEERITIPAEPPSAGPLITPTPTTDTDCPLNCPADFECSRLELVGGATCTPIGPTRPPTSPTTPNTICGRPYQFHTDTERLCPFGLMCERGICVTENKSSSCECDDNTFGMLCEYECCKDCGEKGACYYDSQSGEEFCNCLSGFTGDNCTDIVTTPGHTIEIEKSIWHLWVVGGCVGALVVLIVVLLGTLYILWRNRVILVMKIVHYFKGYEDDDEREWDAFISYKSDKRDEEYVTRVLFPTLEREMGFKTCVHYRDFIPGETIANNIIRAVQGSRRTILIISPNFVKSEFTRFEYQIAQQEMIKQKHRIIPILLDDISDHKDDIDQNLKVILRSVTYLEWPEEGTEKRLAKFWKRLQLSMPKKRKVEDGENKNKAPYLVAPEIGDIKPVIVRDQDDKNMEINVPKDGDGTGVYARIDDERIDKVPNGHMNHNEINVDQYLEILECTRL